jgi:hypothetical protein
MTATSEAAAFEMIKEAHENYDEETRTRAASLAFDNQILKKAFRTLLSKLSSNAKSEVENRAL